MYRLECVYVLRICFFKQTTAYEMRISDWSADVCSSDLLLVGATQLLGGFFQFVRLALQFAAVADRLLGLVEDGNNRLDGDGLAHDDARDQIGRASCRARVGQYV